MNNYCIVVYQQALTNHEVETLSSLCDDVKIEFVHQYTENNIISVMELIFNMPIYGCYRLLTEDIPATALLASKPPLYVGKIDPAFSHYYETVMDLHMRSLDILNAIDELKMSSEEQAMRFNECFNRPSEIIMPPLGELEDQILDDMAYMNADLNQRLEQQRLK